MALAPYTPALYLRRNLGRYRSYPHTTVTPIPGAGYDAKNLVWGEQYLNLWGATPGMDPMQYGNYESVPLLGLGDDVTPQQVLNVADTLSQIFSNPDATLRAKGPAIVAATDKYLLGPMTDAMASHIAPYLWKYFAPALALLYVGVGVSAFYSYSALKATVSKRGVSANSRSYAVRFFIESRSSSGGVTNDAWLARWGQPTKTKLRELLAREGVGVSEARVVDPAGNVIIPWTRRGVSSNRRRSHRRSHR